MQILFTGKLSKISRINGYEFVTDTSLSLAEKYITWILFNYYTATSSKYIPMLKMEKRNLISWFKMGRNHI